MREAAIGAKSFATASLPLFRSKRCALGFGSIYLHRFTGGKVVGVDL
jgi:hypothetical protein